MDDSHIDQLRAEARYRRERRDLYRARMYGQRPTSMTRMRELERAWQAAEDRVRAAEREGTAGEQPTPAPPSDSRHC